MHGPNRYAGDVMLEQHARTIRRVLEGDVQAFVCTCWPVCEYVPCDHDLEPHDPTEGGVAIARLMRAVRERRPAQRAVLTCYLSVPALGDIPSVMLMFDPDTGEWGVGAWDPTAAKEWCAGARLQPPVYLSALTEDQAARVAGLLPHCPQ